MFNNALWESRSHARQPLWFILGPMIFFLVALPFIIEFLGVGVVFGIDVILVLLLLAAVIIFGRKFKWNNNKFVFAVTESGLYFTQTTNSNSYFSVGLNCIKGYTAVPCKQFTTVTVYLTQPENAGVLGNISEIKMIEIENFERLEQVFEQHSIARLQDNANDRKKG